MNRFKMYDLPTDPQESLLQRRLRKRGFKPWNQTALKARKYLCISSSEIPLLTSKNYRSLNKNTIKLLLSKHIKKNPFHNVLFQDEHELFIKITANCIRKYSIQSNDYIPMREGIIKSQLIQYRKIGLLGTGVTESQLKLFKTIFSSYKHLQHLNLTHYQECHRSLLKSIRKLNQLQSLQLRLYLEVLDPNLFKNLKQLKHLTLFVSQSPILRQDQISLKAFANFLRDFALLPILESYNIDCSALQLSSEDKPDFLDLLFSSLDQSKAKRFSVKICHQESIPLKMNSFFQSIDTLVVTSSRNTKFEKLISEIKPQKTLTIISQSPKIKASSKEILFNAFTSLQNAYIKIDPYSAPLKDAKLPQTLKHLTLKVQDHEKKCILFSVVRKLECCNLPFEKP